MSDQREGHGRPRCGKCGKGERRDGYLMCEACRKRQRRYESRRRKVRLSPKECRRCRFLGFTVCQQGNSCRFGSLPYYGKGGAQ